MKTWLKMTGIAAILFLLPVAWLVAVNLSPYLYTKVHGDGGTEKLYKLYRIAKKRVAVSEVRQFIKANGIEFIEHEKDGIISVHNDSVTNAETVLIWHAYGTVTNARFEKEP